MQIWKQDEECNGMFFFSFHFVWKVNYGDMRLSIYSDTDHAEEVSIDLEGNEAAYVDFEKKDTIVTLPDFAGQLQWTGTYEWSQQEMAVYKVNLEKCKKGFKNPPEAQGNIKIIII